MPRKNKYIMQQVNTYDEAYKIGKKYIDDLTINASSVYESDSNIKLPSELSNPIWEMSENSLRNTLSYIFDYLHHQCYMLCINNNDVLLCKLHPFLVKVLSEDCQNYIKIVVCHIATKRT
jgi:hypothetical protein